MSTRVKRKITPFELRILDDTTGDGTAAGHGGGGGRIAIQVLENDFSGSMEALGGSREPAGDVGTIFRSHRESLGGTDAFLNVTELILRGGSDSGASFVRDGWPNDSSCAVLS